MNAEVIVVKLYVNPNHGDYVLLRKSKDEAFRDISRFTFHISRFFVIIGKVVEKKRY